MGKDNQFYLGKKFDLKKNKITNERLTYDPPDLTTYAIVTGMTGSGKTGLCVGLLEEAALQGIPAIVIDPKGDLTNLVLSFPDLAPDDFKPWIDKNSARREKKTIDEIAAKTAALWKKGLAEWGMGSKNIQDLKDSVQRTIYTPGSTTGIPVNILASFEAPDLDWENESETLREKISSTVTAILTLVGLNNINPLQSREHILLANIIEHYWQEHTNLDLVQLIHETQSPPFDQLGAFSLNDFFPKKDRMELAMLLNNVLASPSFQSWIEGPPLDIEAMLYTEDGKPRHSIFYLAHLDDAERMFFVTLIYAAVETWMRKQSGTGDLRALIYFDEIHGYLPPIANPPSKPLIIRLLKTARAFGVGLMLTTQNPVDVDYKALSNAGTWMIGRLQTDQDKQRLLDGLESASGGIKRSEFDHLISDLGKRVFLYHNVHENKPAVFHTRWVMNYLAGPLTLAQVPDLNQLTGAEASTTTKRSVSKKVNTTRASTGKKTRSVNIDIPGKIPQFFLKSDSADKKATYYPALVAVADVRYLRQRPLVDYEHTLLSIIESPSETRQDWESGIGQLGETEALSSNAPKSVKFDSLPDYMRKVTWWSGQEKDFEHWIYETDTASIRSSKVLGVSAGPQISESDFLATCKAAAVEKYRESVEKLESKYESKAKTLEDRIERQKLKVDKYRNTLNSRRADTAFKVGESLLRLASKGKISGLSSSSTKVRMTAEAKARLKEAETVLENYIEDLAILKEEYADKKADLKDKWDDAIDGVKEIKLSPTKQNIRITNFGILWRS